MFKYKWKLLISSIVILIPTVVALILKDQVKHGIRGAWHFTWIFPIILMLLNVLLHTITFREYERVKQNEKIVNLTFFILPVMSVYISAIFMALSLGLEFNVGMVISFVLGISMIVIGNYMPKSVRNRTFGFKIKWTLANDDNWHATHRFAGKLGVISGALMLLCAFLPIMASIIAILVLSVVCSVPPIIYSYLFYKKQLADGTATPEDYNYPEREKDKKNTKLSIAISAVIVVIVAVLMFVGSVSFTLGDDALEVKTTFGGGIEIEYDEIESIEYREDGVKSGRVSGYASAKLLFGWFRNDELGDHTRYTYADSDSAIIIVASGETIVLADETPELTKALYDAILERID